MRFFKLTFFTELNQIFFLNLEQGISRPAPPHHIQSYDQQRHLAAKSANLAVADRLRRYTQVPGVPAVRPERAAPDREEPLYGEVCPYATVELLKNSEETGGNFAAHQHQVSALLE